LKQSSPNDSIAVENRDKSKENQLAQLEDPVDAQNQLIQKLNRNVEGATPTLPTEIGRIKYEYNELVSDTDRLNQKIRKLNFLINRLINENLDQQLQIKEYQRRLPPNVPADT
jgi:septal ring factor EnvC (AmiA/AmiB activator)